MDTREAAAIINKWTERIESKFIGKSKDRKSTYNPSPGGKETVRAPTARNWDISTENVQITGKRYKSPERRALPSSTVTSGDYPDYPRLTRNPPVLDAWQNHQTSWELVCKRFDISHDRYDEFKILQFLDIENIYVEIMLIIN